jgi:hypothetical protein
MGVLGQFYWGRQTLFYIDILYTLILDILDQINEQIH